MRILHITRSMSSESGGTAEAVRLLCVGLALHGAHSEIASLDPMDRRVPFCESGVPFHRLGSRSHGYGYSSLLTSWLCSNAPNFDVMLVHGLWQYGTFGTWLASKRSTLPPYVVFPHGMLDPWFQRTYPLKHFKKRFYWWLVEGRVFRDAGLVLYTSTVERYLAKSESFPFQCREAVVPLGIQVPAGKIEKQIEAFKTKLPELKGRRFVLFLGRLHPKKGPELAIQAFVNLMHILPDDEGRQWALVMAGSATGSGVGAPYLNELKVLSESLAVQKATKATILFPGLLEGDAKWGAFHACDAFILPSHQENFGIAVVEALACGKPVLISDQVNIWREIHDDGAAFVEGDTEAGTLSLLRRWMALSETDKASMGQRARSCFERRFEAKAAAEHLLAVLTESLRSTGGERRC